MTSDSLVSFQGQKLQVKIFSEAEYLIICLLKSKLKYPSFALSVRQISYLLIADE